MRRLIVMAAAVLVLAGCASAPPRPRAQEEWHSPLTILRKYADKDGKLTRAELETGLRKDFAAADTNHDGVLEEDEVRAVNEARLLEDQSAASPLIDWKGRGYVDFDEFAETARALFEQLDVNGDGVLTPQELNPTGAKQGGEQQQPQQQQGEHRHRGGDDQGGQGGNSGGNDGGGSNQLHGEAHSDWSAGPHFP
jgi:Ca2+-binding EF-hand superfamily protein